MKTVRNGQKVWPFCPECGCRLSITQITIKTVEKLRIEHYSFGIRLDERGHDCLLIGSEWFVLPETLSYLFNG
jgi:hypothetical protein